MSDKTQEIKGLYKANVMPTYTPGTVLSSGKGVTVRDADGLSLYDFTSGIGVQNVGYSHPAVVKAIQEQAKYKPWAEYIDKIPYCNHIAHDATFAYSRFANQTTDKSPSILHSLLHLNHPKLKYSCAMNQYEKPVNCY